MHLGHSEPKALSDALFGDGSLHEGIDILFQTDLVPDAEMKEAADKLEFERAIAIRDKIKRLRERIGIRDID